MRHQPLFLSVLLALGVGCTGDKGDPGPAGRDGAPGEAGPAGEAGPPGADAMPATDTGGDGDTASDTADAMPAEDTGDTGSWADTGDIPVDADGDGYAADADCDDSDAAVNPMASEQCDGVDNNCDGVIDADAVDRSTWYIDRDADGFGDERFFVTQCDMPTGYVADATDCDDLASNSHPGAEERCDGADNDCDLEVDEGVRTTWYEDTDGDGYGNASSSADACTAPPGFVFHSDDCDDADPATHPGALERCDDADNDCNGEADDGAVDAVTWFADEDDDGYGDRDTTAVACSIPDGFAGNGADCNDGDAAIHPDGEELCDGVDNDCDGLVDSGASDAIRYYIDADTDGFGAGAGELHCALPEGFVAASGDCDDGDSAVRPDATETCDGVDNNCNSEVDEDAVDALAWYGDGDGDGVGAGDAVMACAAPAGHVAENDDCNDDADAVFPGAVETWYDGVDSDCGGDDDFDADADGHRSDDHGGSDCVDDDPDVVPDAEGLCALGKSCLDILELDRSDGDGAYTIDPDDAATEYSAVEVQCDMTRDGGGWTRLTGDLLQDQAWVEFTHEGGPGTGALGWTETGTFILEPAGSGCSTAAARATVTLPFAFEQWFGSWSGRGKDSGTHQDDNRSDLGWGEVTSDCSGHTKFGTSTATDKHGGEWGGDWNSSGAVRTWTWDSTAVPRTDNVRWEVVDQGPNEDAVFFDIEFWVR